MEQLWQGADEVSTKRSIGYLKNVCSASCITSIQQLYIWFCDIIYVVIMYLLLSCKLEIAHHDSPKSLHDPLVPLGSGTSRKVSYCSVATQRWAWDLTAIPSLYNHHHAIPCHYAINLGNVSTTQHRQVSLWYDAQKRHETKQSFERICTCDCANAALNAPLLFSFVLDLTGGSSEDAVCSLPNDRSHPASSIVLKGKTSSNYKKGLTAKRGHV